MKKTFLVLAGAAIATGAIIALQSYATTTPSLPTHNEISALKSSNNQNRLSAQMRDKMLDLLGGIRSKIATLETKTTTLETKTNNNTLTIEPTDECNCDGNDLCKRNNRKRNCSDLNHIGRFLNDGGFPVEQPHSLKSMAKKSQNLGKKKFCALSSVAFYDADKSSEWSEHICKVFKLNDTWYLYSNGRQGDAYCSATCF